MSKIRIANDMVFNHALDIVDNREMYSALLQKKFGKNWQTVDIGEVQRLLTECYCDNLADCRCTQA